MDLRSLPSLSDAAAKSLSECHGQLNLNGLTELSDAASKVFLERGTGGSSLSLPNGIRGELTEEIAYALIRRWVPGEFRHFSSITEDAVKALIGMDHSLNLDGITFLSDSAAESLSHFGDCLSLNGLESISDAAAASLSKYNGEGLELYGLTELSDAAAKSLAAMDPDKLEADWDVSERINRVRNVGAN